MDSSGPLLQETSSGLYCPAGDFYIDPWRNVSRAVITHAHADHARRGSSRYLTTHEGRQVLRTRMGADAVIDAVPYEEAVVLNGVRISLHPAGHVLGSAQVRIEYRGEVWVVSGDYKVEPERTCRAWEPVRCHTFVTESTFGLPVYRWPDACRVLEEINGWWRNCREENRVAMLFAYSLGKAQRVLAGLDPSIGRIICHSAVEQVNRDYRESGVSLPNTELGGASLSPAEREGVLVIAPPSVSDSVWQRKFGAISTAMASGWMMTRGIRRRQSVDRGFVLSDHADWPGLMKAIHASEAGQILVTHGQTGPMVRWLNEQGFVSRPLKTAFRGEAEDAAEPTDFGPDFGPSAEEGAS